MCVRRFLLAAFAVSLAATALPSRPVQAQAVGGISGGGLTYQQAKRKFPELRPVIFEKADLNGDGLIEPNELPVLQGVYRQMTELG